MGAIGRALTWLFAAGLFLAGLVEAFRAKLLVEFCAAGSLMLLAVIAETLVFIEGHLAAIRRPVAPPKAPDLDGQRLLERKRAEQPFCQRCGCDGVISMELGERIATCPQCGAKL